MAWLLRPPGRVYLVLLAIASLSLARSGWYKERTQKTLFVIGFLIAVMFNLDTIAIGSTLAQSANLRQATAALAEGLTPESVATREHAELELVRLAAAGLPIGYACVGRSAASGEEVQTLTLDALATTCLEQARGYGLGDWLIKLVGWLITAFSGDIGCTVLV